MTGRGVMDDLATLRSELEQRWGAGERIDAICRYAMLPSGKLLRPRLLLESCGAVGGIVEQVMPAAIGSECGHIASLIHDDIIDADEVRRGRAAVHAQFGTDDAIVSGDMLIFYLFRCLSECYDRQVPAHRVVAALKAISAAGLDLCRGQSQEAAICGDLHCGTDAYVLVARLKTAAFFRGACECGAVLGGGSPVEVAALASYGEDLGIAFQIHDDLLCYESSTQIMGKADTSDVRNRRPTLPVILAYRDGDGGVRADIERVFANGMPEHRAHALLGAALRRSGALEHARDWAVGYAQSARDRLAVLPPTPSRELLDHVAELAVNRDA